VATAAFSYLFLIAWSVIALVPFIWMFSSSFKDFVQIFRFPPIFIPNPIVWGNYSRLVTRFPFLLWVGNSALVSVSVTLGGVISCSLAAFAFARIPFRGRDRLFLLYLATMMIPGQVTMIPTYVLMKTFGLINHLGALIIPGMLGGPFGTFLLRQFFMTIPQELEDAARIDGASYFTIYRQIILPLSKPALATLAVFIFLGNWNDFLWPLVIIDSANRKTLPVGVAGMVGQFSTEWGLLMAGATLSIVPILIIFIAAQQYFVEGITLTGLKG
jgi:multiple sugar transport system permease protein